MIDMEAMTAEKIEEGNIPIDVLTDVIWDLEREIILRVAPKCGVSPSQLMFNVSVGDSLFDAVDLYGPVVTFFEVNCYHANESAYTKRLKSQLEACQRTGEDYNKLSRLVWIPFDRTKILKPTGMPKPEMYEKSLSTYFQRLAASVRAGFHDEISDGRLVFFDDTFIYEESELSQLKQALLESPRLRESYGTGADDWERLRTSVGVEA